MMPESGREDWRAIRTLSALKRMQALPDRGGALLSAMTNAELAFAAQNPAYPETSRDSARLALSARIGAPKALAAIDGFVDALPPQSRLSLKDVAENDAVFFGVGRWLRMGLGALAILSILPWIILFAPLDVSFGRLLWLSFLAAPAWILAIGLRRKPARVLLLRGFTDRVVDRSLSAFVQKQLRPYGHVFTLEDDVVRQSSLSMLGGGLSYNPFVLAWRLANIPISLVWRLFDRSRAGPIVIASARDYRGFVRRLTDRFGLNLEMLRAPRNTLIVRVSGAWRRHVLILLLHAADAIVIDLSEITDGAASTLRDILSARVRRNIVFIASNTDEASARAALVAHGFADLTDQLVLYAANGAPQDRPRLRAAMLEAMRRRLSGD